ncbi:uncharacterized protein ACN427_008557 [Glossina fuscipes fuscipes]
MRKSTIVVLGLLLIIQHSFASPVPEAEATDSQHELNTNSELYKAVANDFVKRALPYCENFGKISKQMLEDIKEHKSDDEYDEVKDRLEEYIEAADHLGNSDQEEVLKYLLRLVEHLLAATHEYKEPEAKKNLFYTLLDKHEDEELLEGFKKSFQEYFDGFDAEYGENFSDNGKEVNDDLVKWHKSFVEKDSPAKFVKQFVAFVSFFKLYNPNLFSRE